MHFRKLAALAAATSLAGAQEEAGPRRSPEWEAAYAKAEAALPRLSQSEKIGIVSGVGWGNGPCVGNTSPASSIGYPSLCLQDGPLGVRYASSVTAFTPAIQAAATWDLELVRQRAAYKAAEAKGLGVHVMLGPACGALGKIPAAGRNWEGFGPDPYLMGAATQVTIEGMQSAGVQATAKHYIVNEQEVNRETISSNVGDRAMHELYLWPFAEAVRANVASVMCSYNKVNGTWACENDAVMNKLLKQELGFPGYVMTDWAASTGTASGANSGLDMMMPGSDFNGGTVLWGPQLQTAVNDGRVPQSRVDDAARRILAAWYLLGQDQGYPAVNFGLNVQANHKENVRAVARDGTVLLKNDGAILPLKAPGKIAVIGSSSVNNPQGINACVDRSCNVGSLGMGWGSGTVDYPYVVAPLDAIRARAEQDGTQVAASSTDDANQGAAAAGGADAAFVFITSDSGEGYLTVDGNQGDKNNLDPWHNGNELVRAVAAVNQNVVVVVHSTGPIILESILAQPGVKAVVWAGLPSQENGNALVDVVWGATNPNGKLPYTIGKRAEDYGTAVSRTLEDNFSEGLYIDYRHFDQAGIEPRYEFGFGLSYTNYTYSDVSVTSTATSGPAVGAVGPGGREDLFGEVATVTATVTNSGGVDGAEIVQLYISLPSGAPAAPPKQLRGFQKLRLAAGESGTATFVLRRKDLSYWDVASQNWIVPAGTFGVKVGASSRDIRLEDTLVVS
ncbi:putative glycosyl hydrolase family 3 N terminal domain-containing protein [Colletotrichum karsti]|uniref:Beta-glucosidase cel3A n=1 Tax=Colletotrichum karsti TaxID=1095194 RepID=A0A9P6LQ15_9PEZI|nr:putative glycosyl hydrolase family 3 N terminal domain-containing protein [Colletotrichum karsti]KAF9880217.1 putative glycosyl hydrolase family 3 N terminal domain-containing protein [Colletotrichum karsti]